MTEIEQVKELITQTKGAVGIMTKVSLLEYFINTIETQKEELEGLKRFYQYFKELHGMGLSVVNWHQNRDAEPFDNFFDEAEAEKEKG